MLIIAERINATRKRIGAAFAARDAALIQNEALRQAEAGADYIDINAALSPNAERDCMIWAVEAVRAATDKPLAIDSANPAVVRAGLALVPKGTAILNSVSGEQARLDAMLPLAVEFETKLVAMAMDDLGMPTSTDDRWRALAKIFAATDKAGIARDRILVDPLLRPVSTNPEQMPQVLQMIREIREKGGGAGTVVGLSNVSFGLPARRHKKCRV
ncbi:MAG: dihydropteroate synthase [Planctomycetota bacterium]|nr:dihydropteroate synthase [Planctomycetota bacterium]